MCVVLPRHREQRAAIAALELRHCIVPDGAVDARALMYRADLVLGAGGTMTREAALLGIPTYTLFAGRASAVDAWLIARGLLRRLTRADELAGLQRRASSPRPLAELAERAEAIREAFVQPP
jgi:predicted glycosyltransferase